MQQVLENPTQGVHHVPLDRLQKFASNVNTRTMQMCRLVKYDYQKLIQQSPDHQVLLPAPQVNIDEAPIYVPTNDSIFDLSVNDLNLQQLDRKAVTTSLYPK